MWFPKIQGRTPFVDSYNGLWVTGTGNVSAPTGTGNADILCDIDGVHNNNRGAEYWGYRLAQTFRFLITGQ